MKSGRIKEAISKYKYPLLVLVAGCLLLMLPIGSGGSPEPEQESEEERIAAILMKSSGVGSASVLLSENGAVIVCDGADDPGVRLGIIGAVGAYTGLGCDKIQVLLTEQKTGGAK